MAVLHVGVDIVEVRRVARVRDRFGDRFKRRAFTDHEWDGGRRSAWSLAARFAAKEAALKALGDRAIAYHEIEISREPNQPPRLRLHGRALQRALGLGVVEMAVSLSHTREHAVAVVVLRSEAVGDGGDDG